MTDAKAFYAQAHWGTRYGVTDAAHKTPHKGLDCGLFHGVVQVPALYPGTVVAVAASSTVGHYVQVERANGLFDTYCHIVPAVGVGARVAQGDALGRQAETQQEGGIQWQGQHTHLALSRTMYGWGVWGYVNLDPTPGVIAVLTGTASNGSTALTDPKENDPMMYVKGSAAQIYVVYTDTNGAERLRLANLVEGQLATASGRVIVCSDTQLTQLGAECGWVGGAVTAPPLPYVQVDGGTGGGLTTEQAAQLAAIPNATQLGQALTSTVSLVNGHTDQLKVARTLPAIP